MPKPAANKPCPCGSGKKYKKCCFRTEKAKKDEKKKEKKPLDREQSKKVAKILGMTSEWMDEQND